MGKKRHTAKTGDKKLYKSRFAEINEAAKPKDDDNMYNEIDRYHNEKEKEFVRLDQQPEEEVDDDGYADKEAVMDLAGGASSSEEDDNDSEDDDDEKASDDDDEGEEQEMSTDEDDDDEEMDEEAVTDWGRRKSSYFGGDTADLEIGQNAEDAYLEEEAAKEVQAARYDEMDEDDFVLSDQEDDGEQPKKSSEKDLESVSRDLKKLSRASKRKLLQSHHPELIPLVSHFSEVVKDWNERTRVASNALFSSKDVTPKDVGATEKGLEYLLTKSLLQTSTALNVAAYLLLKAEQAVKDKDADDFVIDGDVGSEIKSHPVMTRLQQLNKLSMKLEDTVESKVSTLSDQVDNLVKAASLMQDEDSDDEDDDQETEESEIEEETEEMAAPSDPVQTGPLSPTEDEKIDEEDEEDIARGVLNDARFGLRPQEVKASAVKTSSSSKSRQRRAAPSDFGDEEKEESRSRKAAQSLASTVNAMQQRSARKSRKPSRHSEGLDAQDEEAAMARGLKMMEDELGPLGDDGDGAFGGGTSAEVDDEIDDGLGGGDGFYNQIKKKTEARKAFKKQMYAVAPKYPGMEAEVDGERAISSVILKNRGLVPHKAKINRNPRVKKREQYRKALIKRKGNVREIRTEEGHKYGGEETGIKTGLSRSRKLGVN